MKTILCLDPNPNDMDHPVLLEYGFHGINLNIEQSLFFLDTRLSMFVIFEELSCTALCNSELSRETVSLYTLFHGFCLDVWIYSQGKQLRHFHFCLPSQKRSTLEGKNLLQKEQILSFKSRPHYGRDVTLENKQEVMEVVSLCKKG